MHAPRIRRPPVAGLGLTLLAFLTWAAPARAADSADPGRPPEAEEGYDPYDGIERDGRIPAIAKPADLPHPERWRYIPEGRLKPGNMLQRFGISSFIAPFFFRGSDVGWGGGVAIVDIDFRDQRRREFAGIFASYTQEQQQSYWITWRRWLHHREVPTGGVLQEERSFVRGFAGYADTLTRRFYGFGADTSSADQTRYSDERVAFALGLQRAWPEPGADLLLRGGFRGEIHNLGRGLPESKPDTRDVFPGLFDSAEDAKLGYLEAGISWDTRDSQRNPYNGWEVSADVEAALLQTDWQVGAVFTLLATRIFRVPGLFHEGGDPHEENPPTDTLAFALRSQASVGELPFFAQPSLGGDRYLRGYVAGRFTDKASWLGAAEYRFWVLTRGIPIWGPIRIERIGLAIFGELGSVASDPGQLFQSRVRFSYGPGLRVTLERAAPFRLDLGFAPDTGPNVVARFGLSF